MSSWQEHIQSLKQDAKDGVRRRSSWRSLETPEYLEWIERYRQAQELADQAAAELTPAVFVERHRPHEGLVGPWPSLSEDEVQRLGVEKAERFYAGTYRR